MRMPIGRRSALPLLAAGALLGLAACSSPDTKFYTLAEVAPARALPRVSGATLGVGRLSIPEILDRPQVVRRASESLLDVDDFSRWGGPLSDGMARVLTGDLRQRLGASRVVQLSAEPIAKPVYTLETQIDRFDVDLEGHLVLQAHWSVASGLDERAVALQQSSDIREDARTGIDGTVSGMSHALGSLADEIAAAVAILPARPGATSGPAAAGPVATGKPASLDMTKPSPR